MIRGGRAAQAAEAAGVQKEFARRSGGHDYVHATGRCQEVHKIGRITPSGAIKEFAIPTKASSPYGITVGADGNIWFTEVALGRIGRIVP